MEALGLKQASVLGFSYGGYTAQQLALDRPDLVSRLILASSGPGFVEGTESNPDALKVSGKPVNTDGDLLYLFFDNTPSSRSAGEAYLARVKLRTRDEDKPVTLAAISAQLAASQEISTQDTSFLAHSARLALPALVTHGIHDLLIPVHRAYTLFRVLPNAKLVVYPNAGHGFPFQFPESFAREVIEFCKSASILWGA